MEGVQLYPLLDGETMFESLAPLLYMHSLPEVASADELQMLKKISGIAEAGAHGAAIAAQPVETDMNTLFHIHSSHNLCPLNATWHTPVLISVAAILALCIVYLQFHPRLSKAYKSCKQVKSQDPMNHDPSEPDISNPPQATLRTELASPPEDSNCQVRFARYSVPTVKTMSEVISECQFSSTHPEQKW
jgi:hypothetical protein